MLFTNKRHTFYFIFLLIVSTGLAGLHWFINPHKLAIWIHTENAGYVYISKQCKGQEALSVTNKHAVNAGNFQYDFSLPKCRLEKITIAGDGAATSHQEISSAAIFTYGKEVYRLFGSSRSLEGEGRLTKDSIPDRAKSVALDSPRVFNVGNFDSSKVSITWPRFLPLILLPVIWLFSRMLANKPHFELADSSIPRVLLAVGALALIATMAVVARTDVSVNPDELTHAASARYYYDHWLKPKIGSPVTLNAHKTNVYGVAYLTTTDPVYQLAAKFAVLVWPFFENDVIALRAFNVALFAVLVLLAFKSVDIRLALIPLFATPQAWYIFSYFNGEAFPLFLSILAMVLFLRLSKPDHSMAAGAHLKQAVIAGCLVGGILLSKQNYWTVLGAIVLLLIARGGYLTRGQFLSLSLGWLVTLLGSFLYFDHTIGLPASAFLLVVCLGIGLMLWPGIILAIKIISQYKTGALKIQTAAVILLGLFAVVSFKMADEAWQNPLPFSAERRDALREVRELTAAPGFKPSDLESGSAKKTSRMRDQGVGLSEILLEKTWLKTSVTSFLGVYGYMNIWPTKYFSYVLLFMFTVITATILVLAGRRNVGRVDYLVPLSILVGITTAITASVGFSWIYDYQPQGKYLLPILPILAGGAVIAGQGAYKSRILQPLVVAAFWLAAASFLLVGIRWIAKQPGVY